MTLDQLKKDSKRRNDYILKLTVLDKQLLDETGEELSKGWAEGRPGRWCNYIKEVSACARFQDSRD